MLFWDFIIIAVFINTIIVMIMIIITGISLIVQDLFNTRLLLEKIRLLFFACFVWIKSGYVCLLVLYLVSMYAFLYLL